MPLTVLCAGDRFTRAADFAAECTAQLADLGPLTLLGVDSAWPDEPFGDVGGVREAAGDPAALAVQARRAEVVLTHLAPITAEVIAAAPGLRVISSTRGGPVNVDLAAATARGVPVAYLPGRNADAAAEYTIGLMIALTRNIGAGAAGLSRGVWDAHWFRREVTGPELGACTVGLVGCGAIGRRVARLLRAFGSTVLIDDPFVDPAEVRALGARPVDRAELLARAEVVSLHARLTPDTRGLADAAFFAALRPGAYLVNAARGELVVTTALEDALGSGRLAGAALDVFDPEPPAAGSALLRLPQVLATPHLAGASRQVATRSAAAAVAAVGSYLRTGRLEHCANPAVAGAGGAGRA